MRVSNRKKREIQQPKINSEEIYNALMNSFDKMEKENVDRVILRLDESEPDTKVLELFLNQKRSNTNSYDPFEMLGKAEQKMITDRKSYRVVALVRDNVGGIAKDPMKYIEEYQRTHLPKLEPDSHLNYWTQGSIYPGETIKEFAENAAESGCLTPSDIEQIVIQGIQEFHKIKERLNRK